MAISTEAGVKSAAELERERLARQAKRAQERAAKKAATAEAETERQAREAAEEARMQARAVREQAEKAAEARKAEIRKQRGIAEARAEAAKAKVREAKAKEARKVVLPFTRPQALGTSSYIASVEAARKQAHKTGEDATTAVIRVKTQYFKEVDQAEATALAEINRQKAGIVKDIRKQLASYNAELTKEIAKLNSGIKEWETEAIEAINKAQNDYEAAINAQLDRPGTEVFDDMRSQGLIPPNAVYKDYDKATGQLDYTIPDTRSGEEIFAAEQAAGNIPSDATYKSYDGKTGQLTYEVPKKRPQMRTASNTTAPGDQSTNVVATAGGVALAGAAVLTMTHVGAGVAAVPTPLTWVIGGIILLTAAIVALINRERIVAGIKDLVGKESQGAAQSSSAVITNNSGTIAYTTAQIRIVPQEKGAGILVFPLRPLTKDVPLPKEVRVPPVPGYRLTAERLEVPGIPTIREPVDVIIRDPFDVPELRQKASNVLAAAIGVQTAAENFTQQGRVSTKTLPMTKKQWETINEALRQGRVAEGRRILRALSRQKVDVGIRESLDAAYREYLRKRAILDTARKTYVASLNPKPVKGRGSTDAKAAAIGVWLVQDIIQQAILEALNRGETMESAMTKAQAQVDQVSKELGLTQQQINAANATVVYQAALSSMTQAALTTAAQGQTEAWPDTKLETRTFQAAQKAFSTIVQTAVDTGTITQTQAKSMTRELTRVAEQVTRLAIKMKLPKPPTKKAPGVDKDVYPDGTIVWRMGSLRGKQGEYKIIPPPYTMMKPISSKTPPKGMVRTTGTPQQTLTFIGGKIPFSNVSFDLGVTDGFIDVKSKTIEFTGHGQQTNVGSRIESTTKGVALTDNPPLIKELLGKPKVKHFQGRGPRTKMETSVIQPTTSKKRGRLVSHGVYSDKQETRISRRRHRGWKRIY